MTGSDTGNTVELADLTLIAFTVCNSIRVLAYVPQVWKAATDDNGAKALSYTTWSLFLVSHVTTAAYSVVNRQDGALAWSTLQRAPPFWLSRPVGGRVSKRLGLPQPAAISSP
jgi:hypothetical protein